MHNSTGSITTPAWAHKYTGTAELHKKTHTHTHTKQKRQGCMWSYLPASNKLYYTPKEGSLNGH